MPVMIFTADDVGIPLPKKKMAFKKKANEISILVLLPARVRAPRRIIEYPKTPEASVGVMFRPYLFILLFK